MILEPAFRPYPASVFSTTGGHDAHLKIAEGCDKHCTYMYHPEDSRQLPQRPDGAVTLQKPLRLQSKV